MQTKFKLLAAVIASSLVVSSFAIAFSNHKIFKLNSQTQDFTITLNASNGGLTNTAYSSTADYSSAHTIYGNEIKLCYKYAKQTAIDQDGYGYGPGEGLCSLDRYSEHNANGYIYNYDVINNMKSITFTFISGGTYGLSLYFSYNSRTFNSDTKTDYGDAKGSTATTKNGAEHTFTADATGYNRFYIESCNNGLSSIYIKNIIITYTCTDMNPEPDTGNSIALNSETPLWSLASTSNSERTVINDIPYFHGGCYPSSNKLNKLYGQGFIYNQYPIYGINSFTVNYSGSGHLRITFGYAVGNYDLYAVETVTSGQEIVFDNSTGYPNFFYLENTSGSKSYVTSDNTGAYSVTTTGNVTTYSSESTTLYHFEQTYDSTQYADIVSMNIGYIGTNQATSEQCLHKYIEITCNGLNVRSAPGTTGTTVLGKLEGGTIGTQYREHLAYRETVYDSDNDPWYRTYFMNQDCYVSGNSNYTTIKQLHDFGNNAENSIVVEAEKRIGDRYLLGAQRYVWSATGAKDNKFDECYYDCSSLMIRAFRDGAGLYPGAATSSQINYGTQITNASNLSLGNLALFTSGNSDVSRANVGHVCLWLGKDSNNTANSELMIQASGSNFTGTVKMYPNWATYWYQYFIEGRSI